MSTQLLCPVYLQILLPLPAASSQNLSPSCLLCCFALAQAGLVSGQVTTGALELADLLLSFGHVAARGIPTNAKPD